MIWIASTLEGSGLINNTKSFCTIMRHHQLLNGLSLRWDKSYDELINVCNISLGINVYFCASATFGISRFLIVQSWEFHGRLEVS